MPLCVMLAGLPVLLVLGRLLASWVIRLLVAKHSK